MAYFIRLTVFFLLVFSSNAFSVPLSLIAPSGFVYSLTGSATGFGVGKDFVSVLNSYFHLPIPTSWVVAGTVPGTFSVVRTCCGVLQTYVASNYLHPAVIPLPPVVKPVGTVLSSGVFQVPSSAGLSHACVGGTNGVFTGTANLQSSKGGIVSYYQKGVFTSDGTACSAPSISPVASNGGNVPASTLKNPSAVPVPVLGSAPYSGTSIALDKSVTHPISLSPSQLASLATSAGAAAGAAAAAVGGTPAAVSAATVSAAGAAAGAAAGGGGGSSTVTNVDFSPVVGAINAGTAAINQTTAAVNTVAKAVSNNSISNFCKKNPKAASCIISNVSSACGAFSCNGDAIQCAMAKQQFDQACRLKNEKNPLLDIGKKMIKGTDISVVNPAKKSARTTVNLPSSLNTSTPFVSSCPADVTFSVMGVTQVIPLSRLCNMLKIIGNIFMALALVNAARIIGGV